MVRIVHTDRYKPASFLYFRTEAFPLQRVRFHPTRRSTCC